MKNKKIAAGLCLLLLLSLTANFFMGGFLATHTPGRCMAERFAGFKSAVKLPQADQKIINDAMDAQKEKFASLKAQIDKSREEVSQSIRADDFNAKKFTAALQQESAAKKEFVLYMRKIRTETLTKLSDEGRAILENAPKRPFPRRPDEGKRGTDYPPFIWEEINTGS